MFVSLQTPEPSNSQTKMKSTELNITIAQTSLFWEQKEVNRAHFSKLLEGIKSGDTDLIVLPEMFTTGFTMNAVAMAEPVNGPTLAWMKALAREKNAVITGSYIVEEGGKYYNRLLWMRADGSYESYNKRHLFRMAHEQETYAFGENKIIVDLKGWRVCPLICYDLRFPVWSRNRGDYDLLIYVANWPERRAYPWKQLLIARAIENQCYVVGVNRIGKDGHDVIHSGDSVVHNFKGEPMSKTQAYQESIETISISMHELEEFRKIFPVEMDADDFELK